MNVSDLRDSWLLWFESEAGEDGIVPTQMATQLLLAKINFKNLFVEMIKMKNLKTSHSVTVSEGWVMSANLAGLRTLNFSDDGGNRKRL